MIPARLECQLLVPGKKCAGAGERTLGLPLKVLDLLRAREHLAVDVKLAASAGDEVRVLRAERDAKEDQLTPSFESAPSSTAIAPKLFPLSHNTTQSWRLTQSRG